MKRLALVAALFPGLAIAGPINHPAGANLTYGDVSINHNLMSSVTNPAFGATMLKEGDNEYRIGIINGGFFFEAGKLDNIADEADEASDALEDTVDSSSFNVVQAGGNITITSTSGSAVIDADQVITDSITSMQDDGFTGTPNEFEAELSRRIATNLTAQVNGAVNDLAAQFVDDITTTLTPSVDALNDDGYLKGGFSGNVPLSPLAVTHSALGGSLTINADVAVQGQVNYMSSYVKPSANVNVQLNDAGGTTTNPNNWSIDETALDPSFEVGSDAAVVTRTAAIQEFGVGYSRKVMNHEKGKLYAGGRFNYYRVGLSKSYIGLEGADETDEILEDQLDASLDMDTGIGIDVGAMWVAKNYRVGATLNNLIAPSFDYKNVSNCTDFSNFVDANDSNNNVTSTVLAECNSNESYEMQPQLRLEGVTSVWDDKLTLGLGYDVNAVSDPFDQEYKWLTLGAGANWGNWIGVRGGYRSNLADNGLTYLTAGLTVLSVNFDFGISQESINFDGDSMPRSAYANISWGLNF